MRLLVQTTGNFQLLHAEQEELVRYEGLTVIEKTQWAGSHVGTGQLLIEGQVNDEATDAEWLETVRECDGDQDLAKASFLERFPVDEASARKPEPPASTKSSTQQQRHNTKGTQGSLAPKPKS